MKSVIVCVGSLILTMSVGGFADEPVIAQSLSILQSAPPLCPDVIEFAVTGDSQSNRGPLVQSQAFKDILQEFNILKPDLVLEVGDIILGGAAEGVLPQWELFRQTIAECKVPYFPVPGNHDISCVQTEKYWIEQMGPTHYTFTYGSCQFIILDSEEVDAKDRLSDEQVGWFKNELESSKSTHIFVFLHQPYFSSYHDPSRQSMDETWNLRWKYLADIMKGYPVRVVFAGHEHGYQDFGIRDGVRYIIAAGGASFGEGKVEDGRFNHFVWVRVKGGEVNLSVMKSGGILASNVAHIDRTAELFDIRRNLMDCEELPIPFGETVDHDITIRIKNPSDSSLRGLLEWEIPDGWTVSPLSREYTVPGKGEAALTFHVTYDQKNKCPYPVPVYSTKYQSERLKEAVEVVNDLPYTPTVAAARASVPVKLDGNLEEWTNAQPVPIQFEAEKFTKEDISGLYRVMWDPEYLYIAYEITDNEHNQPYAGDIVWLADAIEFGINSWSWGFTLTKSGPQVFLYTGEDVSVETIRTDVKVEVRREGARTTYEGAIPARFVKPLLLSAGNYFQFKAEVHDLDTGVAKHSISLNPGGDYAPGFRVFLKELTDFTKM